MPKTAEETKPVETAELSTVFDSPNDYAAVLQEYGIVATEITAPKPPTTLKQNLDQLMTESGPLVDEKGNSIKNDGFTAPLIFLAAEGEYDGDRFEGYDGFYVYAFLHPQRGKIVVTIGRPEGEHDPRVIGWLKQRKAGDLVQIAQVMTSHGFRTFNPVPPQANGKLL